MNPSHRTPFPGRHLDTLFSIGWPGEQIGEASARNRVHVALNALRRSGLKPYLVRDTLGYLLDPAVPVFRAD